MESDAYEPIMQIAQVLKWAQWHHQKHLIFNMVTFHDLWRYLVTWGLLMIFRDKIYHEWSWHITIQMKYSESKYSVESVLGKYLENGWSDQHRDFSVEFVMEKLTTLFFCTWWPFSDLQLWFWRNALHDHFFRPDWVGLCKNWSQSLSSYRFYDHQILHWM